MIASPMKADVLFNADLAPVSFRAANVAAVPLLRCHSEPLARTFGTFSDWKAGLSLTPCFSWVSGSQAAQNRFSGWSRAVKTVETVSSAAPSLFTQLKQAVNERSVESRRKACEISNLVF